MAGNQYYQDNIEQVEAWYEANVPRRAEHELKLINVMEYAQYLQDRHGYWIFNDQLTLSLVIAWLERTIFSGIPLNDAAIALALNSAGDDIIDVLTSVTGQMRPPVKAGDGMRAAYPGGWADVTGNLANAYIHVVNGGPPVFHSD